jgi:tetratricopeptide (TPR) repeat protein
MSAEFKRVKEIFLAALERQSPAGRAAFLAEACGDDEALRRQVEALLRKHEQAGSFLESPPGEPVATVDEQPVTEAPGAVIGPYKLLEQIGEGGFGAVFLAEQTEPVRRKVALKVLKPGMDTRQVIARFEAERQALAIMDHPNIAKVFDGGATPSGRPFFVLELVKGVPITEFCDQNHLSPRQRLELFVPVCQAVQHAHQKGIIHRDLKPSNILVSRHDASPVVKVIDFGVAKALGQELTDKTLFTGVAQMVGTPLYMSPEQAGMSDLDVDTRSDIYSLGVLLYELLTGTTPFDKERLKRAGYDELRRIIREEDPPQPSTRLSTAGPAALTISANRGTEPARLTRLLRGELDWIVMKALEKDRNRRYETANAFALDVQRYLADEPVLACPPSAGYRLRKFARRNKGGLAVAALVLLFLVLLGSGVGWAVRDRAARQANVAGQVEMILTKEVDQFERAQNWPEALAAARRAEAAATAGEADAATAQLAHDHLKDLKFVDQLEKIRMRWTMMVEGKFDFAGTAQEYARAFRDYGVDVEQLAVETSIDRLKTRPPLVIPLAAALDEWADVRRRASKRDSAGWKRLVAVARGIDPEPVRNQVRATLGQPVTPKVRAELRRLAKSIDIRAHHPTTLISLANTLRRAMQTDAALRLLRDAQSFYPGDFWLNTHLGYTLSTQKAHEGAIRFFTGAVCIRPDSAAAHTNLGIALGRLKKPDEAIAAYHKAIELDPKFGIAYCNLGNALARQKKKGEAIVAYRKAVEFGFAYAHEHLGSALYDKKKLPEAVDAFRKAIDFNPTNANAHYGLGLGLHAQKKLSEAIPAYQKAITAYEKASHPDPNITKAHYGLGFALYQQKKLPEAITAYQRAIAINPRYAEAHNGLGNALFDQNKLAGAIDAYKRAIKIDPNYAEPHNGLGHALRRQGRFREAVDAYKQVIKIDPKYPYAYESIGQALRRLNKLPEAIAAFNKAIEVAPNDPWAYSGLGNALRDHKKLPEAIAAHNRAIQIDSRVADFHSDLGVALIDQGKVSEAIAAFNKAIKVNRNFARAHYCLGVTLRNQKKLDEGIAAYRRAVAVEKKMAGASPSLTQYRFCLADLLNDRAWQLATDGDPQSRDLQRAADLAQEAATVFPGLGWRSVKILGVAHYRAGDWKAAIAALEKSIRLRKGGDSFDWLFLAMAHWQLGEKDKARAWYDRAVQWMDKSPPKNEELRRFRAEAAELLGLNEKK